MKNIIKIDRLNIRVKGISSRAAQSAVNNLGSVLLRQLARKQALFSNFKDKGTVNIKNVDAGILPVQTGNDTSPSSLQTRITARVADTIAANVTGSQKEGVKP
jgi:hypothetical protein